jgi:cytidylate kinase
MSERIGAPGGPARPVVTLFESYGSGAAHIGPRVAQALDVPFHPQAFSSQDLETAAADPERQGPLARVLAAMGGSYAGLEGPAVAMAQRDDYDLVMANTRRVQQQARHGGVLLGRNAALILAQHPTALHVLLDGPLAQRVARAAHDAGISVERAAKRQRREDQLRADMSLRLYGWDPRDTDRYHLTVNTGTLDLDTCVAVIVQAARIKAGLHDATTH